MPERDHRLSNIRAISCIAVVILHTFFACFGVFDTTDLQYKASLIIRNLMYWAVPCFIMVTGALLLDPKQSIGYPKIFKKYIPRMVISLIVFTIIFKITDIILGLADPGLASLKDICREVVTGQGWNHMWYLYTMTALYLLIPLVRPFIKHAPRKEILTVIVILTLFLSVIPFITDILNTNSGFYIPVYTIYPLYLILGYYVYGNYFDNQSIVLLSIFGFIVGMSAFTLLSLNDESLVLKGIINNYSFPLTVFGALGLFMLIMKLNKKIRILEFIDQNSFGIYLIHMIPLKVFCIKQIINPYGIGTWFVFVVAAGVFVISLIITALLRKIPLIRKIL